MVDDKYIGLALAIGGTFAIGSSFIVTKKVEIPSVAQTNPHPLSMLSRDSMRLQSTRRSTNQLANTGT